MAEAAFGPVGGIQIFDYLNIGLIDLMEYQLGQTVSAADGKGLLSQINNR